MYFLKQNRFKLTLLFLLTFSYPTQTAYSWFFCFSSSSVATKEHLGIEDALEYLNHLDRITQEKSVIIKNPTIIIDVDDTALYTFQGNQFVYEEVLAFYRKVIDRGYTVFFLTARDKQYEQQTRRTLHSLGYNKDFTHIMSMPTKLKNEIIRGKATITTDKWKELARKAIERVGYTIVLTLDDLRENLQGKYTGATVLISIQHKDQQ